MQFRAFITASAKGLSNAEAVRESEAAVERAAEHIARVEAQQRAELASHAAAEPPLPRERGRGPRVSVL